MACLYSGLWGLVQTLYFSFIFIFPLLLCLLPCEYSELSICVPQWHIWDSQMHLCRWVGETICIQTVPSLSYLMRQLEFLAIFEVTNSLIINYSLIHSFACILFHFLDSQIGGSDPCTPARCFSQRCVPEGLVMNGTVVGRS